MIRKTIAVLILTFSQTNPCLSSFFLDASVTQPSRNALILSNSQINDADFLRAAGSPPEKHYTEIDVSQSFITGLSFIKISIHESLTSLNLAATLIELQDLIQLSVLSNLRTLNLSSCSKFNGDVSEALKKNVSMLPIEELYLNDLNDQCFLKLEDFLSEPTRHNRFRKLTLLSITNAQLDNTISV